MSSPEATDHVIETVAALTLHETAHIAIPLAQTRHRFDIVSKWNIPSGSRVLEIGCGQGDCTAVLAHVVGSEGHVTAVDPGPIDSYGSPYTLAQSQAHLSAGELGSRITWVEADPIAYLESHPDEKYDFVVLVHSIWYFASPATLEAIFLALASHTTRVAVAEWALSASSPNATPHLLAAFAQANLHLRRPGTANIRTIMSPSGIVAAGIKCGGSLLEEHLITPAPALQDGRWEVNDVASSAFLREVESVESEHERNALNALRDTVMAGKSSLASKREQVQCMDTWLGLFGFE